MAEAQQLQLHFMEAEEANSSTESVSQRTVLFRPAQNYMIRWLRIALYIIFGICGQTAATLLTRLYYEKGGTSKWVGTLVQVVGFPILLPYYYIARRKDITPNSTTTAVKTKPPSLLLLVCVYVFLGLLVAGNGYLYSVGFEYLPLSTVALISASQLAFNAFFSYFLNSQKFTPFIINSLILVTISSVLLLVNNSSERPSGVSKGKYVLGFICTILGTATYGLTLASQQLAFRKVLKKQSFKVVMDLIIYQSLIASIATSIGFFASGDWKLLKGEMDGFAPGKVSYVMTLLWTAIAWEVSIFGGVALVFELSALFANVIGALGLPITPIAAMIVFHDKMSGVKGIAMVLAIWGFVSYAYQQYLDDRELIAETKTASEVSQA
ncbi:probable purine permease 10 [Durio zibethinus]|uniref:Probable purine permease n=1 Tax=Durio zibethinus TaxID=66656 RepID=A0A6P6BJI4_DURZI|nr:probable purine permease 10 [Durio zibethinus]